MKVKADYKLTFGYVELQDKCFCKLTYNMVQTGNNKEKRNCKKYQ